MRWQALFVWAGVCKAAEAAKYMFEQNRIKDMKDEEL